MSAVAEQRRAPRSTALDELFTPAYVFDPLHAEFRFTIDVAGNPDAYTSKRVGSFFAADVDGLQQSWNGARVWLQPPYSNLWSWVRKAHHETRFNGCPLAVGLFPATRSEQQGWADYIEPYRDGRWVTDGVTVTTRFLRRRIAFDGPASNGGTGKFPSVIVAWERQT